MNTKPNTAIPQHVAATLFDAVTSGTAEELRSDFQAIVQDLRSAAQRLEAIVRSVPELDDATFERVERKEIPQPTLTDLQVAAACAHDDLSDAIRGLKGAIADSLGEYRPLPSREEN